MKRVFVSYGPNGIGDNSNDFLQQTSHPHLLFTTLVWDSAPAVGVPPAVVTPIDGNTTNWFVPLFFEDDARDIKKRVIDKVISEFGVTKHDVVFLE